MEIFIEQSLEVVLVLILVHCQVEIFIEQSLEVVLVLILLHCQGVLVLGGDASNSTRVQPACTHEQQGNSATRAAEICSIPASPEAETIPCWGEGRDTSTARSTSRT